MVLSGPARGLNRMGIGAKTMKRHRRILKDSIQGVTRGDVRRLARRGGVKRISGGIYDEVRTVLKTRLQKILKECCAIVEYRQKKTITVHDLIFVLNRLGNPIYGFGTMIDR